MIFTYSYNYFGYGDQVIREDPAGAVVVRAWPGHRNIGRGALVGPPWRMVFERERRSTAQWYGGYPCTLDGGPMGHSARSTVPPPPIRLLSRRRKASGEHVG